MTGGVIALVLGAGIASAATGDADEIAGCYHKTTGSLRVVDSGGACQRSEIAISWSRGSGVPDLADGAVVGGPGGVVLDETLSHDDLEADSVRGSELADAAVDTANLVADSVKGGPGGVIEDDSITGDDLASSAVGRDELAPGAVDSAKIDDGAVGTDDLGGGAITTDKLTATVHSALSGPDTLTGSGGNVDFGGVVNNVSVDVGANHKLLLLAQSQLTCTACTNTDPVAVSWRLYESGAPVSEEYDAILTEASPKALASVQALDADTGAPGSHTYELRITARSSSPATVVVSNDSMTALDLGR